MIVRIPYVGILGFYSFQRMTFIATCYHCTTRLCGLFTNILVLTIFILSSGVTGKRSAYKQIQLSIMNASIDNDLVETTKRLSVGASIVTNLDSSNCKLPMKLHPALYNSSLSDISMSTQRHDTNNNNNKNNDNRCTIGVPGFPEFPDCWQGETSQRRNKGDISMSYADEKHKKCATTSKAKIKRQRRRIIRSAVNIIPKQYTSNTGCTGKTIKKRNRDQRKMRRIEKVAQLQNRRRRKREMGLLCKSLSSIKC